MKVQYSLKMSAPMKFVTASILGFGLSKGLTWSRLSVVLQRKRFVSSNSENYMPDDQEDISGNLENMSLQSSTSEPLFEREISKSKDDLYRKLLLPPDQPPNAKILQLAILGTPNSGKSTLMNQLMRWKISAVSKKVHTTRKNTTAVLTRGDTQIVFLDTPGIRDPKERKKYFLEKSLIMDPKRSLENADLVAVIVDAADKWTRNQLSTDILKLLYLHSNIPSILILNKVDAVKTKESLLHITRMLTEEMVGGNKIKISTKTLKKKDENKKDFTDLFDRYEQYLKNRKSREDHQNTRSNGCHGSSSESDECFDAIQSQDNFNSHRDTDISNDNSVNNNIMDEHSKSENEFVKSLQSKLYAEKQRVDSEYSNYVEKLKEVRRLVADKHGWPNFSRVFMISAFNGDGVDELEEYIFSQAKPGNWEFHSSFVTEQSPYEIAKMSVWEKMLDHLPNEIPYMLYPEIILWEVDDDGFLCIVMDIHAHNNRECSILIGPNGQTIKQISEEAKQELLNSFRCEIKLKLQVKMKQSKKKKR